MVESCPEDENISVFVASCRIIEDFSSGEEHERMTVVFVFSFEAVFCYFLIFAQKSKQCRIF